jgi:hypothetical protein
LVSATNPGPIGLSQNLFEYLFSKAACGGFVGHLVAEGVEVAGCFAA